MNPKCPTAIKLVGFTITAARHKVRQFANERCGKAMEAAKRVVTAPMNMARKIRVTTGKILPMYTFGTNWSAPSVAISNRMRSSVLNCIWGKGSKLRCPEIVLGVLSDPTRTVNFSAAASRAFIDARRTLRKCINRRQDFIEMLLMYEPGSKLNGPMHGIMEYAEQLGINFTVTDTQIWMETPIGYNIDLCTDHLSHFRHVIREVCRHALLRQLQQRLVDQDEQMDKHSNVRKGRKDMKGITALIDIKATLGIVKHKCKEKLEHKEGRMDTELLTPGEGDHRKNYLCQPY